MGCSCSSPKPFTLIVDGKEKTVWGLDKIVFTTIASFPSDDQIAAQALWDGLRLFNRDVDLDEEEEFKKALLAVYHDTRKAYEVYEENAKDQDDQP
ncbi:MAG: hypothetical protein JW976_01475 [Syntrophaceae bacterium]|nr:hypothetical protein [Syntrophaceae bacterium]